jgi:hypothetical protein
MTQVSNCQFVVAMGFRDPQADECDPTWYLLSS